MAAKPGAEPFAETVQGRYVRLERLSQRHVGKLWINLGFDQDSSVLDWLPWTKPINAEELWTVFDKLVRDRKFIAYAIVGSPNHVHAPAPGSLPISTEEALGTIGFLDINLQHRTIETGAVLFGSALRRSTAATEAHYLLLRSICDRDGGPAFRRIAWKNDSKNTASRLAAERIGYTYEGTWRNHMFSNGRSRDSDWLSITEDEWPIVKQALETWLRDDNFGQTSHQIRKLQSIRDTIKNEKAAGAD